MDTSRDTQVVLVVATVDEFRRSAVVARLRVFAPCSAEGVSYAAIAEMCIHLDPGAPDFRFGELRVWPMAPVSSSVRQIRDLLHVAWHTGRQVDVWDQQHELLIAGSWRAERGGLGAWLRRYAQLAMGGTGVAPAHALLTSHRGRARYRSVRCEAELCQRDRRAMWTAGAHRGAAPQPC